MDFARRQLLKYGWNEGEGLGKHNNGIKTALRPCMKNDLKGIGFDNENDQAFNWWEQTFNVAAKTVIKETNAEELDEKSEDHYVNHKKVKQSRKRKHNFIIRDFQKEGDAIVFEGSKTVVSEETKISDEELFKICGGRTVHKGARHGINFKGKLARLSKQESLKNKQSKKFHNVCGRLK